MKKKVLAVLLSAAMTAVFAAGCGNTGDSKDGNSEAATEEETAGEDTSLKDIQEAGVMTVGMCPEYPPFESINTEGEIEGFDADLAAAVGEILGVEVEFVNTPYEGLIAGLRQIRL